MRIKEIRLTDFRSFKGEMVLSNISPNVNIVIGKNGSGKSNILSAIQFIFPRDGRYSTEERKSYMYEGDTNSTTVEVLFDNSNGRFPAGPTFTIRRCLDMKKDELLLDGKVVTREELSGLLESAGFSKSNNYYIISQGGADRLGMMTDTERFDLIKEIAGALVYEKDRVSFMEQLEETKHLEKKIEMADKKIDERVAALRAEVEKMIEIERIDEEKNIIECAILKNELNNLNDRIKKMFSQNDGTRESNRRNKLREVQKEVRNLLDKKEELKRKERIDDVLKGDIHCSFEDYQRKKQELERIFEKSNEQSARLSRMKLESFNTQCELKALGYEKAFVSSNIRTGFAENDIEECESEIERYEKNKTVLSNRCEDEIFDEDKLISLIEERKKKWIEKEDIEAREKKYEEEMRRASKMLLSSSGNNRMALEGIRGKSGVRGCVIELITIPDEVFLPFSSVSSSHFFNVVVDNDDVATNLVRGLNGRVTFIPLNRISKDVPVVIDDERMIPLWRQVQSSEEYKPVVRLITKNAYLVSDLKTGVKVNKKYGVNIVTLEGDIITTNGVFSGGYEHKDNITVEYVDTKRKLRKISVEKKRNIESLKSLDERISDMKNEKRLMSDNQRVINTKAYLIFLRKKLSHMRNGITQKSVLNIDRDIEAYKVKDAQISVEINDGNLLLSELKNKASDISKVVKNYESREASMTTIEKLSCLNKRIDELKEEEIRIMCEINKEKENSERGFEAETMVAYRNVLMEKRQNLVGRINALKVSGGERAQINVNSELIERFKQLNLKRKAYSNVNPGCSIQLKELEMKRDDLRKRTEELISSRKDIEDFIVELDRKKESTISLTLSMVCDNFAYFFGKISPTSKGVLIKEGNSIVIEIDGKAYYNTRSLSGGQKTTIALALIFSIQKIDPTSFYVFDEIDANLDQQTVENLCKLLNEIRSSEESPQFIFTTFKPEVLGCGNKFYGVKFHDKRSYVDEITAEDAKSFLSGDAFPS